MKYIFLLGFLLVLASCQNNANKGTAQVGVAANTDILRVMPKSEWAANTLLDAASENDLVTAKKIVQDPDYDLNEMNDQGETPLLIATHRNYVEMATLLIEHGADINVQDHISDSPYLYAGAQGRTEILKFMLEHARPDYSKTNRYGGNALIPAAEKGHLENVRLLLEHGEENVNHINKFGYTALIEAVALTDGSKVYQDIVSLLLKYGADTSIRDNAGFNAREYAAQRGYDNILKILNE